MIRSPRSKSAAFQVTCVVNQNVQIADFVLDTDDLRQCHAWLLRVVGTTKKLCGANFCAMVPPTPQRPPTGRHIGVQRRYEDLQSEIRRRAQGWTRPSRPSAARNWICSINCFAF